MKPKKFGDVQTLVNNTQNKDYFSSKYSLKAKAGGADGLQFGQEIYCLPLISNGIYELPCHAVKVNGARGFKSKFTTYIPCHGYNEETGESDGNATCCRLAQEEWDKYVANGKKGETLISFRSSRFYIPVLLLGNETGSKTATNIPISKLTLTGRDFSYVELSQKAFKGLIEQFKNDLLNNGRMEYGLEGEALYNEIMSQFQKHILKISINKPDGFGTHKKTYSFISFSNKNIGAETGSYDNITRGLTASKKLQAEVAEFITLFENECEGMLTPWNDVELENYVKGVSSVEQEEKEARIVSSGTVPKNNTSNIPKSEQVVIQNELNDFAVDDADDDLFDDESGADIVLDDKPNDSTLSIDIADEDMSFDLEEEDFFGEE